MDIAATLSARSHLRSAKVQLAAARLASGGPGSDRAFATLARAAMREQAGLARAAGAIAASRGGIDIRV